MNGIEQKIETLRAFLRDCDYRYYILDDPNVPDAEYDAKMNELKALERENPSLITPDSPTQRVSGGASREFKTVRHRSPLLSLDNTFSFSQTDPRCGDVSRIYGGTQDRRPFDCAGL